MISVGCTTSSRSHQVTTQTHFKRVHEPPLLNYAFYIRKSDGTSLLGSSNLTTRYWTGVLSIFDSPDCLGDPGKCRASMEFEGGLSCAKFVSPTKVRLVCEKNRFSCISSADPTTDPLVVLVGVWCHVMVVRWLSDIFHVRHETGIAIDVVRDDLQ